jgi:hypothetical protein
MSRAVADELPLTSRRILRFFYPLALSWLFMALEGPVSVSMISRLAEPKINTAAFLVLMSLSLWIESPVIDLLSTSTTLAKSRQSYLQIRRFVFYVMVWVTVLHAAIVLTPIYDLVTHNLLRLPEAVRQAARPALAIMIPWSACIGWRRYLQGILIRYGQTRWVGAGTFVRMAVMSVSAISLALTVRISSVEIAAIALMASVAAEAAFAHWASRPVLRAHFLKDNDEPELSMRRLCQFHFPLTLTTMVMFIAQPMVSAALAQSPDKVLAMASWQVAFTVMWMLRAAVYALPEVVITLAKDAQSQEAMRKFCLRTGLYSSGLLLLLWLSGLAHWVFRNVVGAEPDTAQMATFAFGLGALLPLIGAIQSYLRGLLTLQHLTSSRLYAIGVSISVMAAALYLGTALQWPGVVTAASALTISLLAELGILYAFVRAAAMPVETAPRWAALLKRRA